MPANNSLLMVEHIKRPGFHFGIVSSLNMGSHFSLRFLPSLSLQERALHYQFRRANGAIEETRIVMESTYLEFPLMMKVRSGRINNVAIYLLGGGEFSIDMAARKDTNPAVGQVTTRLAKYDYGPEAGGGIDLFLPYFKLGVELKIGIGIPNLLIDDGSGLTAPVRSLRSKVHALTLTFEAWDRGHGPKHR